VFGAVAGREDYPVVLVSWYGAVAFANWRSGMQGLPLCYNLSTWECNWGTGYRLPTEAEWERAARGGAVGRRFPWTDADTIDHNRANYFSSSAPIYDLALPVGFDPAFSTNTTMPYTSPVGYFPPNGYGLYDVGVTSGSGATIGLAATTTATARIRIRAARPAGPPGCFAEDHGAASPSTSAVHSVAMACGLPGYCEWFPAWP
jgi:hypothetical protein